MYVYSCCVLYQVQDLTHSLRSHILFQFLFVHVLLFAYTCICFFIFICILSLYCNVTSARLDPASVFVFVFLLCIVTSGGLDPASVITHSGRCSGLNAQSAEHSFVHFLFACCCLFVCLFVYKVIIFFCFCWSKLFKWSKCTISYRVIFLHMFLCH